MIAGWRERETERKVHNYLDFVSVALVKNRLSDMTVQCGRGEEMCFFFQHLLQHFRSHTHHIQILNHEDNWFLNGFFEDPKGPIKTLEE